MIGHGLTLWFVMNNCIVPDSLWSVYLNVVKFFDGESDPGSLSISFAKQFFFLQSSDYMFFNRRELNS